MVFAPTSAISAASEPGRNVDPPGFERVVTGFRALLPLGRNWIKLDPSEPMLLRRKDPASDTASTEFPSGRATFKVRGVESMP
jgi:hypothetical protein